NCPSFMAKLSKYVRVVPADENGRVRLADRLFVDENLGLEDRGELALPGVVESRCEEPGVKVVQESSRLVACEVATDTWLLREEFAGAQAVQAAYDLPRDAVCSFGFKFFLVRVGD